MAEGVPAEPKPISHWFVRQDGVVVEESDDQSCRIDDEGRAVIALTAPFKSAETMAVIAEVVEPEAIIQIERMETRGATIRVLSMTVDPQPLRNQDVRVGWQAFGEIDPDYRFEVKGNDE